MSCDCSHMSLHCQIKEIYIKLGKINKRKRKMLVSKCIIILCLVLTSTSILPLNFPTNSFTFSKSSSFSYISFSAINSFQHTKYFITLLIFILFKIFSTFYSSTILTSTNFGSFTLYPFTGSLYLTILLMFTTG